MGKLATTHDLFEDLFHMRFLVLIPAAVLVSILFVVSLPPASVQVAGVPQIPFPDSNGFVSKDLEQIFNALKALTSAIATLTDAVRVITDVLNGLEAALGKWLKYVLKLMISTVVLVFIVDLLLRIVLRFFTSLTLAVDRNTELEGHPRKGAQAPPANPAPGVTPGVGPFGPLMAAPGAGAPPPAVTTRVTMRAPWM